MDASVDPSSNHVRCTSAGEQAFVGFGTLKREERLSGIRNRSGSLKKMEKSIMSEQHTKVKGVVDIVFLIDVSGSMAHCIEALKENIKSFVKTLTSGDGGPNEAGPAVKDFRIKSKNKS